MKKLKIESGKFYKTANGLKAKVIEVDDVYGAVYGWVSDWIEPPTTRTPTQWYLDGVNVNRRFILSEEWIEPEPALEFDWSCLPAWTRFIAMDSNGEWFSYDVSPSRGLSTWLVAEDHVSIPDEYAPKNYTGDWKDSLRENPNPRK